MRSMCDAEVPAKRGHREREIHRERERDRRRQILSWVRVVEVMPAIIIHNKPQGTDKEYLSLFATEICVRLIIKFKN